MGISKYLKSLRSTSFLSIMVSLTLIMGVFTLLLTDAVHANTTRTAVIQELTGTVTVKKSGGSKSFRAYRNMALNQGDHITTEANSSVVLKVLDQEDVITIDENSELYISELKEDGGTKTKFSLWGGSMWAKASSLVDEEDEFEIATPTAIMGVRGTNLMVGVDPETGESKFYIASGQGKVSKKGEEDPDNGTTLNPNEHISIVEDTDEADLDDFKNIADLNDLITNTSHAIIEAIIKSKEAIDRENEEYIEKLQAEQEDTPQNQEEINRIHANLDNLVGNIVKNAIEQNKVDETEIKQLIEKINEQLDEKLDLDNVKAQELTEEQKAKQEQIKLLEEERKKKQAAEKLKQEELKKQNEELQKKLKEQLEKQKAEKEKTLDAAKKKAAEEFTKKLANDAARAAFEAKQKTIEEEKARLNAARVAKDAAEIATEDAAADNQEEDEDIEEENETTYYTLNYFVEGGNGIVSAEIDSIDIQGERIPIESGDQLAAGITVYFTATPDLEYMVNDWMVNSDTVNNPQETFSIEVNQKLNVTVTFKQIPDLEAPTSVTFEESNISYQNRTALMIGEVSGEFIITINKHNPNTDYELFWGNSGGKLGDTAFIVFEQSANEVTYNFDNVEIPADATKILAYSRNSVGFSEGYASLELSEYILPPAPDAVFYTDADKDTLAIDIIDIEPLTDGYNVYWADMEGEKLDGAPFKSIMKKQSDIYFDIAGSDIPPKAMKLLVYSFNVYGESTNHVSVDLEIPQVDYGITVEYAASVEEIALQRIETGDSELTAFTKFTLTNLPEVTYAIRESSTIENLSKKSELLWDGEEILHGTYEAGVGYTGSHIYLVFYDSSINPIGYYIAEGPSDVHIFNDDEIDQVVDEIILENQTTPSSVTSSILVFENEEPNNVIIKLNIHNSQGYPLTNLTLDDFEFILNENPPAGVEIELLLGDYTNGEYLFSFKNYGESSQELAYEFNVKGVNIGSRLINLYSYPFEAPEYAPASVSLSLDTNSFEGLLSGEVVIGRAVEELDIIEYVLYWANAVGNIVYSENTGVPISNISKAESLITYTFENVVIPADAVMLIAYSSNNIGKSSAFAGVAINDFIDLPLDPTSISFIDVDGDAEEISGDIIVTANMHDPNAKFVVYWAKSDGTILYSFTEFTQSSNSVSFPISNLVIPNGATRILAFSENSYGESAGSVSMEFNDKILPPPPDGVTFSGINILLGIITAGELVIDIVDGEAYVDGYNVYFANTEGVKLSVIPFITYGATGSDISDEIINIDFLSEAVQILVYTWNEDGESLYPVSVDLEGILFQ